jgi:uncharacterized membrane protein YfcA
MHQSFLALAILLSATLSGSVGLGFPLIAGPIFLWTYGPSEALLLTSLFTLLSNFLTTVFLHRSLEYEVRWHLILPLLLGLPVGFELLTHLKNSELLRAGFGSLLVMSTGFSLLPWRPHIKQDHPIVEKAIGLLSGVVGGIFAAPAVLPAIWLTLRGVDKKEMRAILQPLVLICQVALILLLVYSGAIKLAGFEVIAIYAPALVLGVLAGIYLFYRVSSRVYSTALSVLVLVSGMVLIFK